MEQVRSSLEQTEKGKVSNAAANYKRVFQLDPLLKGAIRKNLLTERVDIVKPLGWYLDSPTLTDVDIKYLLLYFEENYGLTIEKKIQDAVMVIANENRYHPVRDFLCLFGENPGENIVIHEMGCYNTLCMAGPAPASRHFIRYGRILNDEK